MRSQSCEMEPTRCFRSPPLGKRQLSQVWCEKRTNVQAPALTAHGKPWLGAVTLHNLTCSLHVLFGVWIDSSHHRTLSTDWAEDVFQGNGERRRSTRQMCQEMHKCYMACASAWQHPPLPGEGEGAQKVGQLLTVWKGVPVAGAGDPDKSKPERRVHLGAQAVDLPVWCTQRAQDCSFQESSPMLELALWKQSCFRVSCSPKWVLHSCYPGLSQAPFLGWAHLSILVPLPPRKSVMVLICLTGHSKLFWKTCLHLVPPVTSADKESLPEPHLEGAS